MDFMLQVLSGDISCTECIDETPEPAMGAIEVTRGVTVGRSSKDLDTADDADEDTTDCASDISSVFSSEPEAEWDPEEAEFEEIDELLAAHEAAMRQVSLTAETPLEMPAVRAEKLDWLGVVRRMKKMLEVDFVDSEAFDMTLLRALRLLHAVEYDPEDIYTTVAHSCALAKRCPEEITMPICEGNLRLGAERIVTLVAFAMIDLDDEACELKTWRSHVLPHLTPKALDIIAADMLLSIGGTTHVRAEDWQTTRVEFG